MPDDEIMVGHGTRSLWLACFFNIPYRFYHKKCINMKKIIWSAVVMAGLISFSACNSNKSEDSKEMAEETNERNLDQTIVEDDSEFAVDAADGGLMEVKLAELAKTNGSSQKVKDFAATMIKDHGMANEELKALAQRKNITLPMALGEEKQAEYDKLAKKNGKDFDKAYAAYMVDDHEEDVREFEKAAKECKDEEIRTWAAAKVPALQHHLEMAKAIKDATK
jgi:putative membrane protein